MKPRIVVAILIIVAAIAAGYVWRGVFVYQDHLFGSVPEGTAAYIHLSITPANRRILRDTIAQLKISYPEILGREKLGTEINRPDPFISRDVQEVAIAYAPSATPPYTVLVGTKNENALAGILGDGRMNVVVVNMRNSPSSVSRSQSLSALVRPERLVPVAPNIPIAAVTPLLPETITLNGFIDRWGLVFRTDGRLSRPAPRTTLPLVRALRLGTVQVFNIPLDVILANLDLPMIPDIAAVMPKTVDVAVGLPRSDFTIRFEAPRSLPADSIASLRGLLSRIWPSTEQRTLDGSRADIFVADANAISIRSMGGSLWEANHAQRVEPLFHAWRQMEDIVASTSASFGDVLFETKPIVRIPTRCDLDERRRMFVIGSIGYPRDDASAWFVAIDPVVGNLAICLMPTEQIIEKVAPLKGNPFVDRLFTVFEKIL